MKEIDAFIQFDADITRFKMPQRLGASSDVGMETMYKKNPGMKEWVDMMVTKMHDVKKKSAPVTGNWALDTRSHYDWLSPQVKSTARDYPKWAHAAYFETTTVPKYREALLETSTSGKFLRGDLQRILTAQARPRRLKQGGHKEPTRMVKMYQYPDGLEFEAAEKPDVDIAELVKEQVNQAKMQDKRKALTSVMTRLRKCPAAVARPDTKLMNSAIDAAIDNLEGVRLTCYHDLA